MCTIPTNYAGAIDICWGIFRILVSAKQKEFDSLEENKTFELQKALKDKNIVGCRWVYTLKYKQDGSYEYKA